MWRWSASFTRSSSGSVEAPGAVRRARGSDEMPNLTAWSPQVLSLVRILAGLLFMEHGLMKLAHFPAAQPGLPSPLPPMLLGAGVIEVVAGALIALGLFTRVAAFVASGEMAVAYFMVHAPK